MHVRVCPECDEEYRPEILVCADCGAVLVDSDDETPRAAATPKFARDAEPSQGQEEGVVLCYSSEARDLTPLADELVRAGLPFQILSRVEPRSLPLYDLVVPERATDAARPLVAAVAERHPELGLRVVPAPLSEAEMEAEQPDATCPACDAHLPPDARECPGCGLAFNRTEEGGG